MAKPKKTPRKSYRKPKTHRGNKLTMASVMKKSIAILPPASHAVKGWETGGLKGALANFASAYSGINSNDIEGSKKGAYLGDLFIGYGGMAAAWAFGKVNSRIRVF